MVPPSYSGIDQVCRSSSHGPVSWCNPSGRFTHTTAPVYQIRRSKRKTAVPVFFSFFLVDGRFVKCEQRSGNRDAIHFPRVRQATIRIASQFSFRPVPVSVPIHFPRVRQATIRIASQFSFRPVPVSVPIHFPRVRQATIRIASQFSFRPDSFPSRPPGDNTNRVPVSVRPSFRPRAPVSVPPSNLATRNRSRGEYKRLGSGVEPDRFAVGNNELPRELSRNPCPCRFVKIRMHALSNYDRKVTEGDMTGDSAAEPADQRHPRLAVSSQGIDDTRLICRDGSHRVVMSVGSG